MKRKLSRRMFLHTASGAALALPLLDDISGAKAQAATPFKRLIIIFTPNGTIPDAYFGTGTGTAFQLGEIMGPLAAHKQDLVVVPNLDMTVALDGPGGDAHGLGIGCLLTGTELLAGDQFKAGMGGPGSGWPGGPSVDQVIADRVGKDTKFSSLELAVKRASGTLWTRMSYTAPSEPVTPFDDPQVAFDTIFADVNADPTVLARQNVRRKSVLDGVMGEFTTLSTQLSGADKKKIEQHLNALSEIEGKLSIMTNPDGSCVPPARPTIGSSQEVFRNDSGMEVEDPNAHADVPQRQDIWREIMIAALACDLTRVMSFMMAPSRSDIFMSWIGLSRSHHDFSHDGDGDPARTSLIAINKWYAERIELIISALKSTTEGTGTMFDNSVLLWCNELGIGNSHSHTNIPFMLAGSAGGYFQTGQALNITPGTSHNGLLISLCNAMGLDDVTTFGNAAHCNGPLPGLAV